VAFGVICSSRTCIYHAHRRSLWTKEIYTCPAPSNPNTSVENPSLLDLFKRILKICFRRGEKWKPFRYTPGGFSVCRIWSWFSTHKNAPTIQIIQIRSQKFAPCLLVCVCVCVCVCLSYWRTTGYSDYAIVMLKSISAIVMINYTYVFDNDTEIYI